MTAYLHLCPDGWRLYERWDKACRDNVTHEPSPEEVERENRLWTELQDHKHVCEECRKVEG